MTSIKKELNNMLQRCMSLNGTCFKDVDGKTEIVGRDEAVKDFLKLLAADKTSPREIAEKIKAAWDDNTGELQKALNAVRVEHVGNFIAAESTGADQRRPVCHLLDDRALQDARHPQG